MTYTDVLQSAGWPTDVLILDFETFFSTDYTLRKMSTINYICDARFEFTGLGIGWLNGNVPEFHPAPCVEMCIEELQDHYGLNYEQVTVICHNARFDATILVEKFNINPPYVVDIKDLASHYDSRMSHKLEDLAKLFKLEAKGDTDQFKGVHYADMGKEKCDKLASYCKNDVKIEASLFQILLPMLTNAKFELAVSRHTLSLYLEPAFDFDFDLAGTLSEAMQETVDQELQKIDWVQGYDEKKTVLEIARSKLLFPGILEAYLPPGEHAPMKQGKNEMIPALAKDDPEFQQLLVHPVELVRNLCNARMMARSWPAHVKRINSMTAQARASGGKLRVPLNYYGGHTGRMSGGEKINLQNLGGRGRAGQGTHPLIQKMRNLLRAPDGYILGIADSAQVEARVLAWLAGQDDLLQDFAEGKDPYSKFATKLFGTLVYKPKKDDPEPIIERLEVQRGFGKDSVLGCGYMMGAPRFYSNCLANIKLRPLFKKPLTSNSKQLQEFMQQLTKTLIASGVENYSTPRAGEYDEKFIAYLILLYRTTYPKIPEFWKSVEKSFKWVIKYPHHTSEHLDKNDFCYLDFSNHNGTVHIRLPSGRELFYRHSALKRTTRGSEIRWLHGSLWGGSITENIVQAVARDLLAWWILEMEKTGLNVVMSVHDEIICMLSKADAEQNLQQMFDIMNSSPEWNKGLPLDTEGELSPCYRK